MRLINPGPGEHLDRAAILRLKIAASQAIDRPCPDLVGELEVVSRLAEKQIPMDHKWRVAVDGNRLFWLNRAVWDLVNQMHGPLATDKDMATWARDTVRLNDRRAELISEINILCGFAAGEEKL